MKRLANIIEEPGGAERLADAGIGEIEAELAERKGPRNAGLKLGYQALNQIRPGFVRSFSIRLMPEAASVIDPHIDKAEAGDTALPDYFKANEGQVADELLSMVDRKAESANNATAKKAYGKMRPKAKDNVIGALPRMARMLERELAV